MNEIPIIDIHQVEKTENATNFHINSLNKHLKENEEKFAASHKHNFFICVLFTKGSGNHQIDFHTYAIQPGSVFFIKPGQTHHWEFKTQPEGYIFLHTQDFYENPYLKEKLNQFPFYNSTKNPPLLILSQQEIDDIRPLYEELMREYNNNSSFKNLKIFSLITHMYIELSRIYIPSEKKMRIVTPIHMEIITKLESILEAHYKNEKLPKFYASKLFVSTKHLNRIIKTSLNKTTTDLITDRVVLEAKRLMVHSKNSLTTISHELGYQDYAYFSRVFKRKTGISPKKFIKVM
ncbi:DNA-binding domain-containing protein, AraC-type [Galbibacter orientalis DSM 19592]|uniref:DNA-binding domain-containing protein, AraC-type n=1 Tax=Galbibacter orientalis DSM 19592 TaxID=926559 RepID=I3C0F0_9FLAO|nr:AraC family transcriptional regulator [Galbibacter orientalis]EIJ37093.1 DNA-binding domain-containing protein, AraC-type [Galbibacter orientalis DSM 19592]